MPIKINDTSVTSQILTLFPEIKMYYGNDVFVEIDVIISSDSGDFLSLSKEKGIEIGKK